MTRSRTYEYTSLTGPPAFHSCLSRTVRQSATRRRLHATRSSCLRAHGMGHWGTCAFAWCQAALGPRLWGWPGCAGDGERGLVSRRDGVERGGLCLLEAAPVGTRSPRHNTALWLIAVIGALTGQPTAGRGERSGRLELLQEGLHGEYRAEQCETTQTYGDAGCL